MQKLLCLRKDCELHIEAATQTEIQSKFMIFLCGFGKSTGKRINIATLIIGIF